MFDLRGTMNAAHPLSDLDRMIADAIIGMDTLWGGDVLNPSGTGRFIADSWFSDAPLPIAYTHPSAARLRYTGGVSAKVPDRHAIHSYMAAVDVHGAILGIIDASKSLPRLRRDYLKGLAESIQVMSDLAMEILEKGDPVPYERCVRASTGRDPQQSNPRRKRQQIGELLDRAGYPSSGRKDLIASVDAWRTDRLIPCRSIPALSSAFVSEFDRLAQKNLLPYLPKALHSVPRANIRFLPVTGAWFSGSMNYIGRARREDRSPEYEASYEINDSLQISVPEFQQLVSHEVVPGHVTNFAFLQNLYERGKVGFEATVPAMNTPASTLFEGIANTAILFAHDVVEIDQLPDRDLQIGVLLALLQDDAKNQASYLIWKEGVKQPEVAALLRRDFLVSGERAEQLSGTWGHHPLMGRMYLPCYRAGTEAVAELRLKYPPKHLLPVLYGCRGLVDINTVESAIGS
jgi:hypothetical protein